jgi:hypothetical protein
MPAPVYVAELSPDGNTYVMVSQPTAAGSKAAPTCVASFPGAAHMALGSVVTGGAGSTTMVATGIGGVATAWHFDLARARAADAPFVTLRGLETPPGHEENAKVATQAFVADNGTVLVARPDQGRIYQFPATDTLLGVMG